MEKPTKMTYITGALIAAPALYIWWTSAQVQSEIPWLGPVAAAGVAIYLLMTKFVDVTLVAKKPTQEEYGPTQQFAPPQQPQYGTNPETGEPMKMPPTPPRRGERPWQRS